MSAPDTDIKKQTRRHKGPLLGIVAGVFFAGILFIGYLTWIAEEPDDTAPSANVTIDLE